MAIHSCVYLWCVILVIIPLAESISTVYLTQACNTSDVEIAFGDSLRLEPTSGLRYFGRTTCFLSVEVPSGKLVLLVIRMFDLEQMINGVCVDFINIHDGGNIGAATLNPSPLCDDLPNLPNRTYLSTGNEITIYFSADDSGEGKGFEFIMTPVSSGACSSSETTCLNTSVCVDASLRCNIIDECGDNTDETGCTYPELQDIRLHSNNGLIIGLIFGLLGFPCVVAVLGYVVWAHFRWRLYFKKPMTATMELEPTTYETAYPVTKLYYKEKYHTLYEDPSRKKSHIARKQAESSNGTQSIDPEEM